MGTKVTLAVALVAALAAAGVYYAHQRQAEPVTVTVTLPTTSSPASTFSGVGDLQTAIESIPPGELSEEEIRGLLYMREEEKLARDVYLVLYEKWGLPIFQNIARSEQTHMDAVKTLLDRYDLQDPVSDEIGVFTNPDLQALYDQLISQGSQSVVDALKVGALIEEVDIEDLKSWIAKTDNRDVILVYENLMKGSRNHLRAFTSQLESYGVTYEPQVLSIEEYNEIVGTPMEAGPAGGGGQYGHP